MHVSAEYRQTFEFDVIGRVVVIFHRCIDSPGDFIELDGRAVVAIKVESGEDGIRGRW